MNEVETLERQGYKTTIYYDEDAENPFTNWDCGAELVLHSKAERNFGWTTDEELGTRINEMLGDLNRRHPLSVCLRIIERYVKMFGNVVAILPVAAMDHSGVSVWLGANSHWIDPGGWDSGWVGWLILTKDTWAEWGEPKDPEQALRDSFEPFAAWVSGEVYGYRVEDPDGDELDSCWGHYGYRELDYIKETTKAVIDQEIEDRIKRRENLMNDLGVTDDLAVTMLDEGNATVRNNSSGDEVRVSRDDIPMLAQCLLETYLELKKIQDEAKNA